MIDVIFLDLDGVLRDWIRGIYKLFDCKAIDNKNYHGLPEYICKEYGISKSYFWSRQNESFWENLKPLPWVQDVLDLLPKEKVCILTSPTITSAGGTQSWIYKNLPWFFDNKQYLIGPAKRFCAYKGALLIDDYQVHTEDFLDAGGQSILFPQPWNNNRGEIDNRMEYFKDELAEYKF